MNEITIGDKIYISAKRAAEITGYARDYVGQLCREGHVDAKMVGRSWYVYEPSIRVHRFGEATVPANTPLETLVEAPAEVPAESLVAVQEANVPVNPMASQQTTGSWEAAKYTAEAPQELPELPKHAYEELMPPAEETLTDMQAAWREWFERKQQALETPELETPEVVEARMAATTSSSSATAPAVEADEEEVNVPMHRIQDETVYFEPVHEEEPTQMRAQQHVVAEEDAEPIAIRAIRSNPEPAREARAVQSAYYHEIAVPTAPKIIPVEAMAMPKAIEYSAPEGRIVSERVITKQSKAATTQKGGRRSNAPVVATLLGVCLISIAIAVIGSGKADRYVNTISSENPIINFLVGTREYKR